MLELVESPLPRGSLLVERFSGREAINELPEYQLVVLSQRGDVNVQELVSKKLTLRFDLKNGKNRYWNLLCTGMSEEFNLNRGLRQYVLTLRAEHWLLSQKSDCRIFQRVKTLDIIDTLLREHGIRYADRRGLLKEHPEREYVVQWNETDLNFMLRMMEEDGIFYWIRQTTGTHQIMLCDHPVRYDPGADGKNGMTRFAGGSADTNHITQWTRNFQFIPGKRAGRDWNFETPSHIPEMVVPSRVQLANIRAYELFEYPARALDGPAMERALTIRTQSNAGDHEAVEAVSDVRELAPGAKVTPYDVANPSNRFETSVVASIEHLIVDPTYQTGENRPSYSNGFRSLL
jgi:type VI secretion system secreted protein VgrG